MQYNHLLGQAAALAAALTWASALVLFKRSGERMPPVSLSLFKNAVALLLFAPTLAILMWVEPGHSLDHLREFPIGDYCILMLSGVLGIAIADTLLFYALNLIGVGLMAVVDCVYAPLTLLFAWLYLSETLTWPHYVGGALIIAGVFTATRHKPPAGRSRTQLLAGMALAVLAIALVAFGIVLAKPILGPMAVMWATSIRMAAGTVLLALFALLGRRWKEHWVAFQPAPIWKFAIPAAILGTYLSLIFWIAGFKYTYAPVAAVLNQTSVIFASIFAAVFLHEHFGGRKVAALVIGVIGVVIVSFAGPILAFWKAHQEAIFAGLHGFS